MCVWQVTILVDNHTCVSTMSVKTKTLSQQWVASKAVDILREHTKIGAKKLQDKLQKEHKVTISYGTVWKDREKALANVYGKCEESFELFRWKAQVLMRSPKSFVDIEVLELDGEVYFHHFVLVNHALMVSQKVVDII